jgi:hypothetical protein
MGEPNTIALRSDFGVEECLRRLSNTTDPPKLTLFSRSGYKGSKPVMAKIDGEKIKLWKRRYYRNGFAPFFFGTISPAGQGARIEGYFGMDPFVKVFMVFWLGFVLFVCGSVLIATLSHPFHARDLPAFIIPPGMLIFGIALPKIGAWMARSEEKYLREFLETTLAARSAGAEFSISGRLIANKPLE